ncbi:MAG: sigma-54-dependent Fis family transcriptional regulator [Planctomycetes bacterium]|nr:sigma-54-dependent Fis family transcriptional regulator [Planctomycetota bacterium]
MKIRILLADDEETFRETLTRFLQEEDMFVVPVEDWSAAIEAVDREVFDVAILDIQMPGANGIKVLRHIMKVRPETRVIMITAYGTVEMAVEAIKLGASEYIMKPVIFDDVLLKIQQQSKYQRLQRENVELKDRINSDFGMEHIIGNSPVMQRVSETIRKVAGTKSNVLVTGKSGTGKELVARAIHTLGPTNAKRFVAVNCSAIPETLLESELFGHKKGSFTSAFEDKKGLFEVAHGGTVFLDEIGYMPTSCQVKLLRAVEEKQITPVGATAPVDTDLRLIAATNRDLLNEIKRGRFREDLYYRINVVGVHLPPLSERREDIPILVEHFVDKYNTQMGKTCTRVTESAMQMLIDYEWKGNIRELQNIIERAIIFAEDDVIKASDIGSLGSAAVSADRNGENLNSAMKVYERRHIMRALSRHKQNKSKVAKALSIGLSSLYRKIDELGIGTETHMQNQG